MASATRRLLFCSGKRQPRIAARQVAQRSIQCQRSLSTTTPLQREDRPARPQDDPPTYQSYLPRNLNRELDKDFSKTQAEQLEALSRNLENISLDAASEALGQGKRALPWEEDPPIIEDIDTTVSPGKNGFWAEGEASLGPDEDYYGDDITSHGHGQLEQHRELREYARLAAWELPLLNQLAKPFELPTAATPFRFRYTSYLGEQHPAANKVVVEFCVSDLPKMTQLQKDKLIKLAGPRYNPDKDMIKMSCEMFDTLPQNKRFLGDTISKLIAEAKDKKDTFADVPFDFRHHKPRPYHKFPEEWILTPERKKYLEEKRQAKLKLEDEKTQKGRIVDGQKIIDSSLPFTAPTPEPVMVGGPRGKRLR